jgi:hypothetical protein
MLTKRERVYASIRQKGLDAIPWQFDLTQAVKKKLLVYYGDAWEDVLDDHIRFVMPAIVELPRTG